MSAELWQLARDFAIVSVVSFGGMMSGLPEIQRRMVDANGWMTERTFVDLYGLGYAMPGPNVMVATVVGFYVAGVAGALVATLAIGVPSALIALGVARVWHRFREARLRRVMERGLLAVTVGLTFAGGYLLMRGAAASWVAYALTIVTMAIVMRMPRLHPLWLIAAGGAIGLMGWV